MDGHDNSSGDSGENNSQSQRDSLNEKSPIKPVLSASSPARSLPMSDYSPMKGRKSIASFFTPPHPLKPSSLSNANSPGKQPIVSATTKVEEQSESDLTLSEDESEESGDALNAASEPEVVDAKPPVAATRSIPFALSDEEESLSESEQENEKSAGSSDSEISLIISLPSTDSNEAAASAAIPSKRYVDFSVSEYETSASEDEAANIPVIINDSSEEDEGDRIPVMVFNSKQITITESPELKPPSPRRKQPREAAELLAEPMPVPERPSIVNHKPPSPKRSRALDPEQQMPAVVRPVDARLVENTAAVNMAAYQMKFNTPNPALIPPAVPRVIPIAPVPGIVRGQMFAKDYLPMGASALTPVFKPKTGYVYDERMLHHFDPHDSEHPEKPARITSIYEKLRDAKLLEKAHRIPIQVKLAEFSPEVQSIHDPKYCRMINQTSLIRNLEELHQISSQFNSVYINPSTAISATVAAAATIELCQAIGRGDVENGFAIVRPPGHHAEHDEAMGFCIYNNVAVAASSLLRKNLARRILILDWDVHHGNGTQNAFNESGDVLYVSLHRYDGAKFYPHIEEANCTYVGSGTAGLGKSVNVAWSGAGYGDADYLYAFTRLIMPIAREFNPDFVIVSAGFDAAAGDPIGECDLSTYGYSMMLQELMSLAGGKLAVVLEGGYNLEVISKCYEACVRMLLKEAPPMAPGPMVASPKAILAVESTVICQSPYWKCLFPKPAHIPLENIPQFPLTSILDHFWREECKRKFNLMQIPGMFKSCSESFVQKYSSRVLASEGALFNPDILIVFAHESGPVHSNSFISSLCLQPSKIAQSQPFLPLLQHVHDQGAAYSFIDIQVPARTWKLKQTALTNESESQELNVLFALLWDRLISRSGCRNVFFVASGSPIYAIGNLLNTREIELQVRGCFFFSSSLFIPIINSSPSRSSWYQRNAHVIVPSQEPIRKAIGNAAPAFGACFSAGQWLMADSAAAVGEFKMEILNFIRTRLIQKQNI